MRANSQLLVWLTGAAVISSAAFARADIVRLKQGGEVRGELLDQDSSTEGPLTIRTTVGTIVTLSRDELDFVQRRSLPIEEYVTLARRLDDSVQAHWELAEWCRVRQLDDQRREQLEQILDIDPEHEDARRVLGYVKHLGHWTTRDDLMISRGYVRHKGRWITRQELDLIEKTGAQREAELSWIPRIRLWVNWLRGDNLQKRQQGLDELQNVRDPSAVPALVKHLGQSEHQALRMLLVQILSRIEGPAPARPLVERWLLDGDDQVRQAALAAVLADRREEALPVLVAALKHQSNPIVSRAAAGLEQLADMRAVPALIDALVTTHIVEVQVPANNGIGFAVGPGGRAAVGSPQAFSGGLPADIEIMARTGQLPYGVSVYNATPTLLKTVAVSVDVKNSAVLSALVTLTGKNLGYNERDWQVWWALQKG